MARYDVGQRVSIIFNIKTRTDAFWRQAATLELERAVIYSFTKRGSLLSIRMLLGSLSAPMSDGSVSNLGENVPPSGVGSEV